MSAPPFDPAPLVEALIGLLPSSRPLALHEPHFAGREWECLKDCLDSGWVSSAGGHVERFERLLAERVGVAHAVATNTGTAALHAALLVAGVGAGCEVIVPALTFVATANAVAQCGAVPHFADSDPETLGLSPEALDDHLSRVATLDGGICRNRATGRRVAAVVPVHIFGHPVAMDRLTEVAARWSLIIIEDAAESLGSLFRGRATGSLGRLAALSFNGNKIITTGGGGAILTDDDALARRARHLTTTAKQPHPWAFVHDAVGYNYRMPNLNAALGVAQLERLDFMLAAKRRLAMRYRDGLAGLAGVAWVDEPAGARSNWWLNAVRLPDAAARDAVLAATHARGLPTRPAWEPMHRLAPHADCPRAPLPVAERLAEQLVCLPSGMSAAILEGPS